MTLNELVAVEVMGAPVIGINDPLPNGFYLRRSTAYYGADAGNKRCDPFCPSASIADTMECIERFCDFTLEKSGLNWTATVEGWATASSPSREVAICLAALRAVGVSEERIGQAADLARGK